MDKKQELAALVGRIDSYLQTKYKIESKSNEKDYDEIKSLLSELVKLFKTFKLEIPKDLLKAPQVTVKAPDVNVAAPIVNVPKAQPIVNVVERDYSESINKELKKVQKLLESVKIDSSVKNPLAVRLSDGNKFIEQLTSVVTQAVGGGSGTPTVATTLSGIRGVPVVNPDGSNIAGGSGSAAYSDSGDTDKKGLVDEDRHVQVDVLTTPTTTVTATNLDIRDIDAATDDIAVYGDVGVLDQLDLANSNPATVAIVDATGNQITSFGGGVQYTEGDTDATITGTAMMFESDVVTHTLSVLNQDTPMPAQLFGDSLTALQNIDTNTAPLSNIDSTVSTLALESGGNLQSVATSLTPTALADTMANPTIPNVGSFIMGYNGTTWDRAHVLYSTAENEATQTGIFTIPMNRVFDGTNWDRMPGNSTDGTLVNLGTNNDVTITGTATTKETRAATPAQTAVNDTNSSTTILASNANRLGATIANDSSAVLYLLLGSGTASATNYTVRMTQYSYYEVPYNYTGQINGIWATDPNDGAARVTELT